VATADPELVLASTSPYRKALLERLGLPFRCLDPALDEEPLKARGLPPAELAERLARAKAAMAVARAPRAVVVGADQVCALDGEVLSKPGDAEHARALLARLAGRTHTLFTSVYVLAPGKTSGWCDETRLTMRALDEHQIARYVAADEPSDCIYKVEARGVTLFERIESEDFTAIQGLPLLRLTRELVALGFDVP
jgi:septum formation protein